MFAELYKSDVVIYYLAVFIGFIGITMMLVFVPFKSVATLMMMLSGFGVVALGITLWLAALLWEFKKKFLDKPHSSIHE